MEKKIIYSVLVLIVLVAAVILIGNSSNQELLNVDSEGVSFFDQESLTSVIASDVVVELSEAEIEGILFMREEEKLAYDVYLTLYDEWEIETFSNIASAEWTHMDAVKSLIDKYELEDSSSGEIGDFNNEKLQGLNDDLVEAGRVSELEALKVGAAIEEIDIMDLEEYLLETSNEDLILVYENLLKGSRNHLRSFVKQIEKYEESYIPGYLDLDDYEDIINSDIERGSGRK